MKKMTAGRRLALSVGMSAAVISAAAPAVAAADTPDSGSGGSASTSTGSSPTASANPSGSDATSRGDAASAPATGSTSGPSVTVSSADATGAASSSSESASDATPSTDPSTSPTAAKPPAQSESTPPAESSSDVGESPSPSTPPTPSTAATTPTIVDTPEKPYGKHAAPEPASTTRDASSTPVFATSATSQTPEQSVPSTAATEYEPYVDWRSGSEVESLKSISGKEASVSQAPVENEIDSAGTAPAAASALAMGSLGVGGATFRSRSSSLQRDSLGTALLAAGPTADTVEVADPWAAILSQYPGYVDLPLPGQPGYTRDQRGTEIFTDNAIASNEKTFKAWLDDTTWAAAKAGDPNDKYFTLDDVPLAKWVGNTMPNSAWLNAVDDVAFAGYRSGALEHHSGYATGFYDPDYNNPGGPIYYTNTTADTVLVTIYRPMQGDGTYEEIALEPGKVLEIAKPSPLSYSVLTVQAPKGEDGRVNILTTQVLGYPELTKDIRVIDLPGSVPSGNAAFDNSVYVYATGHVDNYSFYPNTATPAQWTFTPTPAPTLPEPELPPGTNPGTVNELAKALSKIMTSKSYDVLSDMVSLVGTVLGQSRYTVVSASAGIGTAVAYLNQGENEKAAIQVVSVVADVFGEVIKVAKLTPVLTLSVLAVQVVSYAAQQAIDTDWSDPGSVFRYAAAHPDETVAELNKAAEQVGSDLALKLLTAFLKVNA